MVERRVYRVNLLAYEAVLERELFRRIHSIRESGLLDVLGYILVLLLESGQAFVDLLQHTAAFTERSLVLLQAWGELPDLVLELLHLPLDGFPLLRERTTHLLDAHHEVAHEVARPALRPH